MKKYEFTNELTEKAFGVYSNSDLTFYKDADGVFYYGLNQNDQPSEVGTLDDVNELLESFAPISASDVLKNLESLVGKEMDSDDVICAFEDFEENGETHVYVGKSDNSGYDYIAYIDTADATEFLISVDAKNVITGVEMN